MLLMEDILLKLGVLIQMQKHQLIQKEDGEDFIPTPKSVVFSHQFSSIAGAGPVTGPIIAAMFGWLPVLLWLLIGGIFFGAVHDFAALYASVKNEGKSIGGLIEQYIGKAGRKFFFLFAWIFTLLVIAAFSDIVANTLMEYHKMVLYLHPMHLLHQFQCYL